MVNYDDLHKLLEMDFGQMRVRKVTSGYAASDEAIHAFVTHLTTFFSQFSNDPSAEVLAEYQKLMGHLTQKINDSEFRYFNEKYKDDGFKEDDALDLAKCCRLKSFKEIPNLMQFWAATETWGGTIRNANPHSLVVKKMQNWSNLIDGTARRVSSLFVNHQQDTEEANLSCSRKLAI